jgi:hypothetical protein
VDDLVHVKMKSGHMSLGFGLALKRNVVVV